MSHRVLVCGGRDFTDWEYAWKVLDAYVSEVSPITEVVHGGARGADTIAGQWAEARGISVRSFSADWDKYGKAAGSIRNLRMLTEAHPDVVIAFPGGRGTAHMVRRAKLAGVEVREVP